MVRKCVAVVTVVFLMGTTFVFSFAGGVAQEPSAASGNIRITLKKSFITIYKNRATIDADDYVIDKAHAHPNPASKDGDMHVAGRAESIGLPIVAEIMNAKDEKAAVDRVHALEGTGKTCKMSGAWRLWCEHAGTTQQVQGAALAPFDTTNPAHVFEIHPVMKIDGIDCTGSFKPIKGFTPKDAHDAFVHYENVRCLIKPNGDAVTLVTHMAGYNYVEFILELNEKPFPLKDGIAVQCKVRDLEGETLVLNRRMIFAEGTAPYDKVKGLDKGKRLHVLGLPRIDLALLDWRVANVDNPKYKDEEPLKWNLPYEIIVVAVYPTGTAVNDGESASAGVPESAPRLATDDHVIRPAVGGRSSGSGGLFGRRSILRPRRVR